jgi:ubiquinone/menaquinone biosynthesis C-methylase UbiE
MSMPLSITQPMLQFKSLEEIFERYLARAPLAHALHRTAEAKHVRQLTIARPVLDLGCGAGEFAEAALRTPFDMGTDISDKQLRRAQLSKCYLALRRGDARCLPFAGGQFRSVVSVSVLEHVPNPERAVAEVFRVLQPGGSFVGTVELADLHDHLYYPGLLQRVGLSVLGRLYICLHDRLFRHYSLLSKQQWEELLVGNGFDLILSRKIVSPHVTCCWDRLLAVAWPYRLLGRWGRVAIWRPGWLRRVAGRTLLGLVREEEADGSSLFFIARKKPVDGSPTARMRLLDQEPLPPLLGSGSGEEKLFGACTAAATGPGPFVG